MKKFPICLPAVLFDRSNMSPAAAQEQRLADAVGLVWEMHWNDRAAQRRLENSPWNKEKVT
jgi:hypothetical protein